MGCDYTYSHAAALCVHLPEESRVLRCEHPELEWSEDTRFLSQIDYLLRILLWRDSKDAKYKRNFPTPNQSPEERARIVKKLTKTNKKRIDEILGRRE